MSNNEAECWLCKSPAVRSETDHENRWFYQCSNTNCGDYVISVRFANTQKNSNEIRHNLQEKARKYKGSDMIPEGAFLDINTAEIKVVSKKQR